MTASSDKKTAVVLIAHGTVESLDDLPEFLKNIRRGHDAPPDLIAEVRRRYEAIGGHSPLYDITREVATKLEARLGLPTKIAMRLFHPYPKDVIADLAKDGVERIVVTPLAQHSAAIYGDAMKTAAKDVAGDSIEVISAANWGRTRTLTRAFADAVAAELAKVPAAEDVAVVFTAHSLPTAIIKAGDPYETEVRASAEAIAKELSARKMRDDIDYVVAFQSQGIGTGMEWLGPDLNSTLDKLVNTSGTRHIVVAPIGFLADHVEILYDLDIEAKAWAEERGIVLYRSASLNAGDGLIDALEGVTREVLVHASSTTSSGSN